MNPGRELDALIAEKVMGWIKQDNSEAIDDWRIPKVDAMAKEMGDAGAFLTTRRSFYYEQGMNQRCDFKPSRFITDAWEVVEKMISDGWEISEGGYSMSTKKWDFTFNNGCSSQGPRCDTAPHAICLAALAAVERK